MRFCYVLLVSASLLGMIGCGSNGTVVVMDTSMGPVKMELYDSSAPITVKNFLKYVDDKHYDGTIFHRVIDGFMIQGGGIDLNGKEKLAGGGVPIKNEAYNGKLNKRGTLAMARTDDPHSATDEFFINVKDNNFLDRKPGPGNEGYAVFGQVIDGMEVVDKIAKVKTNAKDSPVEPVIIKSIRRVSP
jgi:peptidyl-prolyl cis-trans isomerase B (cyclophilin B)